ncbi:hypothetical protein [Agromyces aerolatus]|uniref:hypothetical protein n=1 Tax=Agromyces sp. LY-1074 TaxID=3074080 RepID=UPI00285FFA7A|nr:MULTISPECIES: hypothetical protein [unclassified Agromyces]MDR5699370.1 hypothetical protein [Agromyces sp. LY-1074]MDR5705666.1 hypothetical protein [Agromyces sp. LY-1358]
MGRRRARGRRVSWLAVLGWSGIGMLLAGAFFAALGALNQNLYGASSFVERYLEAIADDEITTAATTPGVALSEAELDAMGLPADVSTAMLRSNVVGSGPQDITIIDDEARDDGTHVVTASYRLESRIVETTFEVQPIAPLYGVLNRWEFARSPLAVIDVTAAHNPFFMVGSLTLDTRARKSGDELAAFTQTAPYLAIAPAVYEFDYDSTLLTAQPEEVTVEPSERTSVTVSSQATPAFTERVQAQVDQFLEACATQPVLQPTDCPFGMVIDDRVVGDPAWSISASPIVSLTPGDDAFEMPPTAGVAHLSVDLQSLFDGDYYTLEEDETFTLALDARIRTDGSISVQLK